MRRRLLIVNPEDNITHACRALFVNETRKNRAGWLLTAADIRKIVYGATGRVDPSGSGWNVGFNRQVNHFWEVIPATDFFAMRDQPAAVAAMRRNLTTTAFYRLLPRGYERLREERGGSYDPNVYDASVWSARPMEASAEIFEGLHYRSGHEPIFATDPMALGRTWAHEVVQDAIRQHEDLETYVAHDEWDREFFQARQGTDETELAHELVGEWNLHDDWETSDPFDPWSDLFNQAAMAQARADVEMYRDTRKRWKIRKAVFSIGTQSPIADMFDAETGRMLRLNEIGNEALEIALENEIREATKSKANSAEIEFIPLKVNGPFEGLHGGEYTFDFDVLAGR